MKMTNKTRTNKTDKIPMTFVPEMLFITITLGTLVKKWIHTQWNNITTQLKNNPKSMDTRPPSESSESDEESTTGPPGLTPCDSSTSLEDLISRQGIIIDAPFRYWGDNDDYNYSDDDNNNDNDYDNDNEYDGYNFYEDLWNDYDDSDYNSQDEDFGHNPDYQNLWQELLDNFRNLNRAVSQNSSEPPED